MIEALEHQRRLAHHELFPPLLKTSALSAYRSERPTHES